MLSDIQIHGYYQKSNVRSISNRDDYTNVRMEGIIYGRLLFCGRKNTLMDHRSVLGLSRKNIRWIYLGIFICQFILVILLLLYYIRSVWDFVNNFLDDIIGLKEQSFIVVYALLIVFFISSVFILIRFHNRAIKQNALKPALAII